MSTINTLNKNIWFPEKFKIWYQDGSILVGESMDDWISFPNEGVLYIYEWTSNGNLAKVNSASDWYWIHPESGVGCSQSSGWEISVWEELVLPEGCLHPKKGKWTTDEHIDQVSLEVISFSKSVLQGGWS